MRITIDGDYFDLRIPSYIDFVCFFEFIKSKQIKKEPVLIDDVFFSNGCLGRMDIEERKEKWFVGSFNGENNPTTTEIPENYSENVLILPVLFPITEDGKKDVRFVKEVDFGEILYGGNAYIKKNNELVPVNLANRDKTLCIGDTLEEAYQLSWYKYYDVLVCTKPIGINYSAADILDMWGHCYYDQCESYVNNQ